MIAHDDDKHLNDLRYIRWQGIAMAQFSVAIALLSGLSISAIGAGLSMLEFDDFAQQVPYQLAFVLALLLFVAAVAFCLMATISRALDFRLTARKVRGRSDLILFGLNDRQFGRISWLLFWVAVLSFIVGVWLFLTSIGFYFTSKLSCCH